jgi:hypothetical protein
MTALLRACMPHRAVAADIGTPEKPRRLLCDNVNDAPSEEGKSPGRLESHNG